jgi:hypothetical protein
MQRRDGLQRPDLGAGRGRDAPPVGSWCGSWERRSACGKLAQRGLAALRVPHWGSGAWHCGREGAGGRMGGSR